MVQRFTPTFIASRKKSSLRPRRLFVPRFEPTRVSRVVHASVHYLSRQVSLLPVNTVLCHAPRATASIHSLVSNCKPLHGSLSPSLFFLFCFFFLHHSAVGSGVPHFSFPLFKPWEPTWSLDMWHCTQPAPTIACYKLFAVTMQCQKIVFVIYSSDEPNAVRRHRKRSNRGRKLESFSCRSHLEAFLKDNIVAEMELQENIDDNRRSEPFSEETENYRSDYATKLCNKTIPLFFP